MFSVVAGLFLIHKRELKHTWSRNNSVPSTHTKDSTCSVFSLTICVICQRALYIMSLLIRIFLWLNTSLSMRTDSVPVRIMSSFHNKALWEPNPQFYIVPQLVNPSALVSVWPLLHLSAVSDLNERILAENSGISRVWLQKTPNVQLWPAPRGSSRLPPIIRSVTLLSWLPHFSPNWGVQAEEEWGRLLAPLPWTLSVARQPAGCCGSGVQRSSGSLRREGCAPTHLSHTDQHTPQLMGERQRSE